LPLTALFGTQQWIAVLDPAGELLFRELYGELNGQDVDERVMTPRFDPSDGNLVLSGWFAGSATIDGVMLTSQPDGNGVASDDAILAKVAPDGTGFWAETFGDGAEQRGLSAAVGPGREVVQAGGYRGVISFDGSAVPCAATECLYVVRTSP
jgi:hypothetical protein